MRDHEIELIAALVEGRLDDESEARALIASSAEYREEYEAQRLAYEALRDAGTVALGESERAALRRDLWTELRSEATPKSRSPWYYRWVPVTAGLFVVVGLVAVLGQVGGGDDASEETMSLADAPLEATTSTAEASAASDEDFGESEPAPASGAATATTAVAEEGADSAAGDGSGETAELYADEAAMVRRGDFAGGELEPVEDSETLSGQVSQCLDTLGIGEYRVVATLPTQTRETTATTIGGTTTSVAPTEIESLFVAIPDIADTASVPVAFVDIDDCDLVYLHE
jgi:hypothetical protein